MLLFDLYFISIQILSHTSVYNTMRSLDLPYIPIAEARGFTATSGNTGGARRSS